jgi:hypothetical protein
MREDTEDRGPLFEDPQVPCLQLRSLDIELDDAEPISVSTYQDDDRWGLWSRPLIERNDRQWHGIYRWRALADLPIGHVDHVSVFLDDGVVAEVFLRIGRQPLLLVAGEVYETFGEGLRIHRLDESVLAFTDPDAATSITWVPARLDLTPTTLSR